MNQMITILGPTASGKTTLAAALAADIGGEIISADSRQVYRRMDIGTGKDLEDYQVGDKQISYHLIDICEPGTRYNLFRYQEDFARVYDDIITRGNIPVLCGGTGLYLEAVLGAYSLSPVPQNETLRKELQGMSLEQLSVMLEELKRQNGDKMHNTTDVDTAQRAIRAIEIETYKLKHPAEEREFPSIQSTIFGVNIDRDERRKRISHRLQQRLEHGMVEEVRQLIDSGVEPPNLIYYGLEYKYVTEYVIGTISYEEMFNRLEIAIHQFAKRQMTWFRGMECRGFKIHWIDASLPLPDKIMLIKQVAQLP